MDRPITNKWMRKQVSGCDVQVSGINLGTQYIGQIEII